jgi:hypothetical protein
MTNAAIPNRVRSEMLTANEARRASASLERIAKHTGTNMQVRAVPMASARRIGGPVNSRV